MTMHYVVGQNAWQYKSPMEVHPCSSIGVTIYNYEYDDYNYVFLFVCPLYIIRCGSCKPPENTEHRFCIVDNDIHFSLFYLSVFLHIPAVCEDSRFLLIMIIDYIFLGLLAVGCVVGVYIVYLDGKVLVKDLIEYGKGILHSTRGR